jgi:SAM-dependent methyltransferase
MLPSGSRVLGVGCGTGRPVSEMLSKAGLQVVGFDIAPRMVELARERVNGPFTISDMLEYNPEGRFAVVFIIFFLNFNFRMLISTPLSINTRMHSRQVGSWLSDRCRAIAT